MASILDGCCEAIVSHHGNHCLRGMAMLKLGLRRTLRGHCCALYGGAYREQNVAWAGVAQLVEHLICNQRVGGSSPFASSSSRSRKRKTDLVVLLLPFWRCRPPVIPSRVVYPLDSHFESTTGLMG